jgi:hypothetical protein
MDSCPYSIYPEGWQVASRGGMMKSEDTFQIDNKVKLIEDQIRQQSFSAFRQSEEMR